MSPRKKKGQGRGKQSKEDRARNTPAAQAFMREMKREGFRVVFEGDNTLFLHPCMQPGAEYRTKLQNREFLSDEEKSEIVDNYLHNFEEDLRNGALEGTFVIRENLCCPHLGQVLCKALLEKNVHKDMLSLLNRCNDKLSIAIKGTVGGNQKVLPPLWMNILTMIVHDSTSGQLMIAKNIGPLVHCMIDERRKLFLDNDIWHEGLRCFFCLVYIIMSSKKGLVTMISYEELLPFIAQACSWKVSRGDIVEEAMRLQLANSISDSCFEAQRVIYWVICEAEWKASDSPLEAIATAPLLSNDPDCSDSTIVGFIRMMSSEQQDDDEFLQFIVEKLLVNDFVDARVIAELIGWLRDSFDADQFVMNMILSILGLDDDYTHIPRSDSRFAAAIRCGLLELCINSHNNSQSMTLDIILKGIYSMAIHRNTSCALRERTSEISAALDELLRKNRPSYKVISPIVNHMLEMGTPTCCNCLKKFHREKLRFCSCCNVECYCSRSCQSESWRAGHNRVCNEMAKDTELLKKAGVTEMVIKRYSTIQNNVMMAGCRFVQLNMEAVQECLAEAEDISEVIVVIDFREAPPCIKLSTMKDKDTHSGYVQFLFVSPVFYEFTKKVGQTEIVIDKFIPQFQGRLS